jgi:serine/threonine protein phosphatase PrpC
VVLGIQKILRVIEVADAHRSGQDRAEVFELDDQVVVVVADGAGGTGNGAAASQAIVDSVRALANAPPDWCGLLDELDGDTERLSNGQSTAVIVAIRDGILSGASVGDSGASLLKGSELIDLTDGQQRKPLVGGGCAPSRIAPTEFAGGTLLVASDGLLRYAKRTDIIRVASGEDLQAAARGLVDLVRLPNGNLQDDVAIVLCREVR